MQYNAAAEDSGIVQPTEMMTSHALPYEWDDVPGEPHTRGKCLGLNRSAFECLFGCFCNT